MDKPKTIREQIAKIIGEELPWREEDLLEFADKIIKVTDALYKAKYKEYHCKYSTINHGIGLSGKVEEIIVHCSMNPENDYKDSAIQEFKRRVGG